MFGFRIKHFIKITLAVQIHFIENDTYALLSHSAAALVTSGTATLETALFEVPQVVCYKGNAISYQIAKRLVNVDYISLVNLIVNRPLVKELLQNELTRENLKEELSIILNKEKNELIYIDCFVHAPAKKKRDFMMHLEYIISSAKFQ